ncbi:hypothetical protein [Amycolatopsis sp. 3B14]|uniref:hypothetical protein n=1 Tax=Amycolatopsis sp. 3B14 TaxID=3243600 RepID=UPI003D96B43E
MTVVDHDVTIGVTAAAQVARGVSGPWNYPVRTPFGSIAAALAASGSTLTSVADLGEVVEHTNRSRCGRGAAVFSLRGGEAIARRVRSSAVSAFVALPLGGTWASGFGRVHWADGLRESAYTRATTVPRFPSLVRMLIALRHGWR